MKNTSLISGTALMALLLLLNGCGDKSSDNIQPLPPFNHPQFVADDDFALPTPADVLAVTANRTSSEVLALTGSEFEAGLSQNVAAQGAAAQFTPDWTGSASGFAGLAYAIYSFELPDAYDGSSALPLLWTDVPLDTAGVWIGLSNWSENRWDWFPMPANGGVDPGGAALAKAINPNQPGKGQMKVAVVKTGNEAAKLGNLQIGALAVSADSLCAIPSATSAPVGGIVQIDVETGATAHPFQFVNMVSVTVEAGAAYVPGSFNVGQQGGGNVDIDGLWPGANPAGMLMLDSFVWEESIGNGLKRIEFSLAPYGGTDIANASGTVFNFALLFNQLGTYTLGFQQSDGVRSRTYYSEFDETQPTYYWSDVTNNQSGVANSILVY